MNSAHEAQRSAESNIDELNEQIKSYESELMAIGSLELQLDEAQAKITAYESSSGDLRKQLESAQFDLDNKTSNVASAEESSANRKQNSTTCARRMSLNLKSAVEIQRCKI